MRTIDADALLEKVEKIHPWEPYPSKYAQGIRHCMELVSLLIQDAPTIEPERETGEWIAIVAELEDHKIIVEGYNCSKCGRYDAERDNFCPDCGARMSGREQECN